jgi:hypothetical protein
MYKQHLLKTWDAGRQARRAHARGRVGVYVRRCSRVSCVCMREQADGLALCFASCAWGFTAWNAWQNAVESDRGVLEGVIEGSLMGLLTYMLYHMLLLLYYYILLLYYSIRYI